MLCDLISGVTHGHCVLLSSLKVSRCVQPTVCGRGSSHHIWKGGMLESLWASCSLSGRPGYYQVSLALLLSVIGSAADLRRLFEASSVWEQQLLQGVIQLCSLVCVWYKGTPAE